MSQTTMQLYPAEAKRLITARGMVPTEASAAAYLNRSARAAIYRRTTSAEIRDDGAILLWLVNRDFVLYERGGVNAYRDTLTATEQTGA